MATVVVTFSGVADRSSVSRLASVIRASVVTGSISEIDLAKGGLPAPNPPAIKLFGEAADGDSSVLDGLETTKNPFEQYVFGQPGAGGARVDADPAVVGQVAEQDPDHPERDIEAGRDLGHRAHGPAERVDLA